jgi:hypothetical protein
MMMYQHDSGHAVALLRGRLEAIRRRAETTYDVAELEPYLIDLKEFLKANVKHMEVFASVLLELTNEWPSGSVEVLEFTMRDLRWPEIKAALERSLGSPGDSATNRCARHVLEVYEIDWPGGDIYTSYRKAGD